MIKTISMEMMIKATNIPVEGADKKRASDMGEKSQVGQRLVAHDAEERSDEQHLVDDDRDEDGQDDRDEDDEDDRDKDGDDDRDEDGENDRDEEVEEIDLKP